MNDPAEDNRNRHPTPEFATTHWSVVLRAQATDDTERLAALDRLCRAYWYPVYAYARRCGHAPPDAEDLTQGFFAGLLRRDALATVTPARGRFRSFLLASFNHHAADERDRARRQKRGGGQEPISLDALNAEERYALEPVEFQDPAKLYDRRWALTVLDRVVERLRAELTAAGKGELFEHLQSFLKSDRGGLRQADVAARLQMTENAVAVAVHRLRQRYRQLLRVEVAQTVADPTEVETELRDLLAALRG